MSSSANTVLLRDVAQVLKAEEVEFILIGAAALAFHGYPRFTQDVDFAVAIDPRRLKDLTTKLPGKATFESPDAQAPLGGVTTVIRGDGKVQILNYDNHSGGGFPGLVRDALARSTQMLHGVPVVTLEDLILFKASAGGRKSRADVAELLVRTSPNLELLRKLANEYGIRQDLEYVLDLDR